MRQVAQDGGEARVVLDDQDAARVGRQLLAVVVDAGGPHGRRRGAVGARRGRAVRRRGDAAGGGAAARAPGAGGRCAAA